MSLSILCVTKCEPHAWPFLENMRDLALTLGAQFVLGADGAFAAAEACRRMDADRIVAVSSRGYVESVLDECIQQCDGDYVLRLDDDESCSLAMERWLALGAYLTEPHWKFCTANMWTPTHFPLDSPLWPDHHTRLSIKAMAGGRSTPHAGSPHGGGVLAPVIHVHHKFLVKSFEERKAVARRYDAFAEGYGTGDGLRPFSLPETCYQELTLAPLGYGIVREWSESELIRAPLGAMR